MCITLLYYAGWDSQNRPIRPVYVVAGQTHGATLHSTPPDTDARSTAHVTSGFVMFGDVRCTHGTRLTTAYPFFEFKFWVRAEPYTWFR